MQINNLRIKFTVFYQAWQVIAPDGRILEQFDTKENAVKCAKSITDFVKVGGRVNQ